jgi:hypothetical protein
MLKIIQNPEFFLGMLKIPKRAFQSFLFFLFFSPFFLCLLLKTNNIGISKMKSNLVIYRFPKDWAISTINLNVL